MSGLALTHARIRLQQPQQLVMYFLGSHESPARSTIERMSLLLR
jgi:hypothetical protein